MTPEELAHEKEVAFYAASVEAWYSTSLEHDKSIFALSGGGIGLLITLLTTIGASSITTLWLYGASITCFVACLVMLLVIFRRNRQHIVEVLGCETVVDDPVLKRLDLGVMCTFGVAVIFTAIVGIVSASDSYENKLKEAKEKAMAIEKKAQLLQGTKVNGSVSGMVGLTKSFNGLSSVRPPAASQTTAPAQSAQPSGSANSGGSTTSNGSGPQR